MNHAALIGMRAMAEAVAQLGDWLIVARIDGQLSVKMFNITRERAEREAKLYRGGMAISEAEYDRLSARQPRFDPVDCGGAFDGFSVSSDADSGL